MKLSTYTVILAASCTSLAQTVSFTQPASGAFLTLGTPFTVQVAQSNSPTLSTNKQLIISVGDAQPDTGLGNEVLYDGPYSPQNQPNGGGFSQNFTVTIPASFGAPPNANLLLTHRYGLGAGSNTPFLDTRILPITIVESS